MRAATIDTIKVSELVEDFDLYPRASVDTGHVSQIVQAIEAGTQLPPIIICDKTKRIVDGFHRARAWRRVHGDDSEIPVQFRHYKNESDLFLEAMRLNSEHGRNMTSFDRTVAIQKAVRFELDPQLIADALHMKVERITEFKVERCARLKDGRRMIALKMPIRHLAGGTITERQEAVIPKLGGNQQTFYVNQLIVLIESGLLDRGNEQLMERLEVLKELLRTV